MTSREESLEMALSWLVFFFTNLGSVGVIDSGHPGRVPIRYPFMKALRSGQGLFRFSGNSYCEDPEFEMDSASLAPAKFLNIKGFGVAGQMLNPAV